MYGEFAKMNEITPEIEEASISIRRVQRTRVKIIENSKLLKRWGRVPSPDGDGVSEYLFGAHKVFRGIIEGDYAETEVLRVYLRIATLVGEKPKKKY